MRKLLFTTSTFNLDNFTAGHQRVLAAWDFLVRTSLENTLKFTQNLEEILHVEGLDALLIGPYDLSASMGLTAKFESPEFNAVMNQIRTLCRQYHIPCGVHVMMPEPAVLVKRITEGYLVIAYSIDAVFLHICAENTRTRPEMISVNPQNQLPENGTKR